MIIKPLTEKEIAELNLWPAGEYDYEIAQATDKISKNQNEMIKLVLNVYNSQGTCRIVYDYLLEAIPHKIRHLCEASGLLDKYEMGAFYAADFVGKRGTLKLAIQKDKTGQYSDKNVIADYLVKKETTNAPAELNDEMPWS